MPRTEAPAALKLLKGRGPGVDSGGRRVKTPPPFRRVAPNPPTWMSAEAKAEWKRVTPGLTRLDLLKEEDRALLTAYCETWATFVSATRVVTRDGLTMRGPGEHPVQVPRPEVGIARSAARDLRAFASHFGLSPSAEMALGKVGDDGDPTNPFS